MQQTGQVRLQTPGVTRNRIGVFRFLAVQALFMSTIWALFGRQQNVLNVSRLTSTEYGNNGSGLGNNQFHRANNESFGFFEDIPENEWDLLRERMRKVQPNKCSHCGGGNNANAWFQNNYEPEFACRHEQRVGKLGDGGKWVCDPHRLKDKRDCLVYSVGSNNDFSFEKAILETIGPHCEIHTFDPGNYSMGAARVGAPGKVHYHQWGIDGETKVSPQQEVFKTLRQTVEELGHVNRTVDIFKIDCEGCEMSSHKTWINDTELHGVSLQQILVEVHSQGGRKGQVFQVKEPEMSAFFDALHHHGYVMFHKEPNIHWFHAWPCVEFAFLKLHPSFFDE